MNLPPVIQAKSVELAPATVVVEAAPVAAAVKPERFFHLDALRAALMFWGILVHTSTLDSSNRLFRACAEISGLVRMEAFFVISGFLAYMLLKKYGAKVMVKKRLLAIGLPFITALVLLNPPTNFLIYTYHNGAISFTDYLAGKGLQSPKGPMNWHLHLWFLVALFVYSMLAPLIERAVDAVVKRGTTGSWKIPGELAFLAMAAAVAGACLTSRIGFEIGKSALPGESHYVIRSIGNFLPFYTLGMLLFAAPGLREVFSKVHWTQTALSCALLVAANRLGGEDPDRLQEVLILAAQSYVAITLSSLLFWVAGKCVRGASETARQLSDSAYSVYLFHFVTIYLCAHALRGALPGALLLPAVAAATFAVTLSLHSFVIRRVPVLELLLNGKPLRRAR